MSFFDGKVDVKKLTGAKKGAVTRRLNRYEAKKSLEHREKLVDKMFSRVRRENLRRLGFWPSDFFGDEF